MAKKTKKIDLNGATIFNRAQVMERGNAAFLTDCDSLFPSPSDKMLHVRGRLSTYTTSDSTGGNQGWPLVGSNDSSSQRRPEFFKAVWPINKTDDYLVISSNMVPYAWSDSGTFVRAYQYSTGTVTTNGTDYYVSGTSTSWLGKIVGGYILNISATNTTRPYLITTCNNSTQLSTEAIIPAVTGANYTIYAGCWDYTNPLPHIDMYNQALIWSFPSRGDAALGIGGAGKGPWYTTASDSLSTNFAHLDIAKQANDFAIFQGYVILGCVAEFDTSWTTTQNRIRWSAPGTYNDFTSAGSGYADIQNIGHIQFLMATQGCVYVFGNMGTGVLRPTGDTSVPFSYQLAAQDIISGSQPVLYNNIIHFWGVDGQLYQATDSGISMVITPITLAKYAARYDYQICFSYAKPLDCFITAIHNATTGEEATIYIHSKDHKQFTKLNPPAQGAKSAQCAFGIPRYHTDSKGLCISYDNYSNTSSSNLFLGGDTDPPLIYINDQDLSTSPYYPFFEFAPVEFESQQVRVVGLRIGYYCNTSGTALIVPMWTTSDSSYRLHGNQYTNGTNSYFGSPWFATGLVPDEYLNVTAANATGTCTANPLSSMNDSNSWYSHALWDYHNSSWYRSYTVLNSTSRGITPTPAASAAPRFYVYPAKSISRNTTYAMDTRLEGEVVFGMNYIVSDLILRVYLLPNTTTGGYTYHITSVVVEYEDAGFRLETANNVSRS